MSLLQDARAMSDDLIDLRHRLHKRPEIGLRLPRTQEAVLGALGSLETEIHTGIDLGSVTAVIRGTGVTDPSRPRRSVLLRADMDALPVHEEVESSFRSTVPGAAHACGHDLHTAMLVGAAHLLVAHRERLAGDVVLMFQPGEEGFDGARRMIAEGVLMAGGALVDTAYGIHVRSNLLPCGQVGSRTGPLMGASDGLYVQVIGEGGHGSSPHRTRDPVQAICEMVMSLQTAINRSIDAFNPVVVTVGSLHAGSRRNVVPDEATFEATVRTYDRGVRDQVREIAKRVCHGVAQANNVEVRVEFREEYPLTDNDGAACRLGLDVAAELFGPDAAVTLERPMPGTEDFSRVLGHVPGAMFLMGACLDGRDPSTAPSNHSPHAAYEDRVVPDGAALFAGMALRSLPPDLSVVHTGHRVIDLGQTVPD